MDFDTRQLPKLIAQNSLKCFFVVSQWKFFLLVMSRTWIFMLLFTSFLTVSSQPKKKIFMGTLVLSYGGDEQGFQAAMEYATEIVNNRSDILKDYELVVRYAETLVSKVRPRFLGFILHDNI